MLLPQRHVVHEEPYPPSPAHRPTATEALDDLQALEDTLDLLSDPQALQEIDEARAEIAKGHVLDAEQLRAKYLDR